MILLKFEDALASLELNDFATAKVKSKTVSIVMIGKL